MGGGCPSIVYRDGRPWLAIGSSGGPRLISGVFQSLLNLTLFGQTLEAAVAAPRIHCEQPRKLYIEPSFPDATRAALADCGYELTVTSYMGCNQAVAVDNGRVTTGSDPRGGTGIGVWTTDQARSAKGSIRCESAR
jgi:gamma-glutamyltranspeptidase/glutathione hydrolase